MDDGKAAGPKLKWWSRPGGTARTEPAAGAGAPGPSGAQPAEDWLMRPPEPRDGAAQRPAPGPPEGAIPAEMAEETTELARTPDGTASPSTAPVTTPSVTTAPDATAPEIAVPDASAPNAPRTPEDGTGGTRPEPSTVTLGKVPEGTRETAADGTTKTTAPAPATAEAPAAAAPAPETAEASPLAGVTAGGPPAAPPRQRPLHAEDPYGTPPYGGPGPWAPAPPVQRPVATPAHGTVLPPAPGPLPPYGAPAGTAPPRPAAEPAAPQPAPGGPHDPAPLDPAGPPPPAAPGDHGGAPPAGHSAGPHGAWQQYDPWSAPLQGGPVVPPSSARRRGPLVAGAVALALLAGGIGGGVGAYVERYGGINDIQLSQAGGDEGGRRPDSVAGIAQAALPGVVTIHVRGSAEQGTGTGFVLDHQGHILTNNHVVEPAADGGEISVTFSGGQTAKARVVGRDGGYDLAVVQVEGVTGLRPLPLGNSDAVRVGDPVVAIGAPFDLANTVTSGIISAKQRPITAGGAKGDGSDVSYVDALQTDAPINPGNSGGPLVDARARVIGINSAIRAADSGGGLESGAQGGSIGLGFAIPINQAKRVAEELINTGRATHPVIGVTLEMEYAGDGARVSAQSKDGKRPVAPDGPAEKAGIKAGDVITAVDGAPVHSGQELIVKIRSHRPGDTLALTVQRGGKERSVRLSLGSSSTG
ncbi:trypsin-like peptidase domain-containing protein [Streptomyces kronopolitis]